MARLSFALLFCLVVGLAVGCETEPSGSGDGEVEAPQVCKDYCEVEVSCDQVDRQECEDGCTDYYLAAAGVGGFCPQSFQDLFACVAGLDCDEYQAWLDETPAGGFPCRDQQSKYKLDCE
jgi:hypothetical protein